MADDEEIIAGLRSIARRLEGVNVDRADSGRAPARVGSKWMVVLAAAAAVVVALAGALTLPSDDEQVDTVPAGPPRSCQPAEVPSESDPFAGLDYRIDLEALPTGFEQSTDAGPVYFEDRSGDPSQPGPSLSFLQLNDVEAASLVQRSVETGGQAREVAGRAAAVEVGQSQPVTTVIWIEINASSVAQIVATRVDPDVAISLLDALRFDADDPGCGPPGGLSACEGVCQPAPSTLAGESDVPLVISYPDRMELWDGDNVELIRVLTTAGEGRDGGSSGYELGPVSLGPDQVWFTEYAGPAHAPSIWRLDLATNEREALVEDADLPAISPDGSRLAYVRGLDGPPADGAPQQIVVRELSTGAEHVIGGFETGGGPAAMAIRALEWSPDGERLLFGDSYEEHRAGILDPTTATSVSDALPLDGTVIAAAWLNNDEVAAVHCCSTPSEGPVAYVRMSAATGGITGAIEGTDGVAIDLAVTSDGRLMFLGAQNTLEQTELGPRPTTLGVPGPNGAVLLENVSAADW